MVSSSAELSHTEMCLSDEVDYPAPETASKKSRCFLRHTPRKSVVLLHLRNMSAVTKGENALFQVASNAIAVSRRVKRRRESEKSSLTLRVMAPSEGVRPFAFRLCASTRFSASCGLEIHIKKTGSRRSPFQPCHSNRVVPALNQKAWVTPIEKALTSPLAAPEPTRSLLPAPPPRTMLSPSAYSA